MHPKNEDSHAIAHCADGSVLLVVCDGMGGMGRGDEASQLAVKELIRSLDTTGGSVSDRLRTAIANADREIREKLCANGRGRPGSTAVIVHISRDDAHVAWAGDSRAYLVRGGAVVERTRDHKLVQELLDSGQLTAAEARQSAWSSVVTRALGGRVPGEPVVVPELFDAPWKLLPGDRLLLCSDGLCDLVRDEEVPRFLAEPLPVATEQLVLAALRRGGHDNITVIVAAVEEVKAEPVETGALREGEKRWPRRSWAVAGVIAAVSLGGLFVAWWLF